MTPLRQVIFPQSTASHCISDRRNEPYILHATHFITSFITTFVEFLPFGNSMQKTSFFRLHVTHLIVTLHSENHETIREDNLQQTLFSLIDTDYLAQVGQTYPMGARKLMGIPLSDLRSLARDYTGTKNWKQIVDTQLSDNTFEETLLKIIIYSSAHLSFEELQKRLTAFLPLIDSQMLCDTACLAFRIAVEYPDATLHLLDTYLQSPQPFTQRFALVTLLDYYVNSDYIDHTLIRYAQVHPDHPYVQDALEWGYMVCYMGFPDKTLEALRQSTLPKNACQSVIQRILLSPRINDNLKRQLSSIATNYHEL